MPCAVVNYRWLPSYQRRLARYFSLYVSTTLQVYLSTVSFNLRLPTVKPQAPTNPTDPSPVLPFHPSDSQCFAHIRPVLVPVTLIVLPNAGLYSSDR